MKYSIDKLTVAGISLVFGGISPLFAIERPLEGSVEKAPARPTGGILDQARPEEPVSPSNPMLNHRQKGIAYFGVGGEVVSEALSSHLGIQTGLLLTTIDRQSPAGLAGLRKHDVLLDIEGKILSSQNCLRAAMTRYNPGDVVTVSMIREGEKIEQKITLGEAPVAQPPIPGSPNLHARRSAVRPLMSPFEANQALMEQLDQAFGSEMPGSLQQLRLGFDGGKFHHPEDFKMDLRQTGTMSLVDQEGSIELRTNNGERHLIVRSPDGTLLFEGPYGSEEEKEALPKELRERVQKFDRSNQIDFSRSSGVRGFFGNE